MAKGSSLFSARRLAGLLILIAIFIFVAGQSLWSIYVESQTYTILFPRSTILTEEAYAQIDAATEILKKDERIHVQIIGHTSVQGDAGANQALSLRRAEVVKGELEYRGITEDRISVEGRGGTEPLNRNASETDRGYALRSGRVVMTLSRFIDSPLSYIKSK